MEQNILILASLSRRVEALEFTQNCLVEVSSGKFKNNIDDSSVRRKVCLAYTDFSKVESESLWLPPDEMKLKIKESLAETSQESAQSISLSADLSILINETADSLTYLQSHCLVILYLEAEDFDDKVNRLIFLSVPLSLLLSLSLPYKKLLKA